MARPSRKHNFGTWAALYGAWDLGPTVAKYEPDPSGERAMGMVLSPHRLESGRIEVAAKVLEEPSPESAEEVQVRIVVGHDNDTKASFAFGLGGYESMYVAEEFQPGRGWRSMRYAGEPNVKPGKEYRMVVQVNGLDASLTVDEVEVLSVSLPGPISADGVGLSAWGPAAVEFRSFSIKAEPARAFVVMQFSDPYNALYQDVIKPVCKQEGFMPTRADDVYGPGIILQDIIKGIRDASVVVAEITPANANVFYELGYAHAIGTPTILLATRGQPLPFDVSGYRCIFYDDSIGGKRAVEDQLRKHLRRI